MFFILSKILHFLLMPLTWVIGLLFGAVFSKNKKKRRHFLVDGLFILVIFSNPFLVNSTMKWWEEPPKNFSEIEKHDIGIVLTGITNLKKAPHDRTYFNKGADRIYHAVLLYKKKKINKILITGGNIAFGKEGVSESATLKSFLLNSGIPERDIILENQAKNTRQNAIFTKNKLKSLNFQDKKFILITSAFHMKRAKACFDKVELKTTTFPTDFYSKDNNNWESFFPSEKKLHHSAVLLHEWFGMATYKLFGYI